MILGPISVHVSLMLCVGHELRQRLTGTSVVKGHYSNWSLEYYYLHVTMQFLG